MALGILAKKITNAFKFHKEAKGDMAKLKKKACGVLPHAFRFNTILFILVELPPVLLEHFPVLHQKIQ